MFKRYTICPKCPMLIVWEDESPENCGIECCPSSRSVFPGESTKVLLRSPFCWVSSYGDKAMPFVQICLLVGLPKGNCRSLPRNPWMLSRRMRSPCFLHGPFCQDGEFLLMITP